MNAGDQFVPIFSECEESVGDCLIESGPGESGGAAGFVAEALAPVGGIAETVYVLLLALESKLN